MANLVKALVVVEHAAGRIRPATLSAITFAEAVVAPGGGAVCLLVIGSNADKIVDEARRYGRDILVADHPRLTPATADVHAQLIAYAVHDHQCDLLVAASTSYAKDVVSRTAGLLGGAMVSEVMGHEWEDRRLLLDRPMYAGAVTATVELTGSPSIITIRPTAYAPAKPNAGQGHVATLAVDEATLPDLIHVEDMVSRTGVRPDVTEARVVVSGGRAVKSAEDFECYVGGLADALGGAAGSSRVLVDAGIAPNSLQVGQTGKIVAPELYIALGISGAVQHLAGMKNSKVIVAINNDPDAPIFEVADYGIVGDVQEVVPRLIELVKQRT